MEMLVTVAIVAILAALALTAFQKVQSSALQAHSLSNVRQVTAAMLLYAADNEQRLPWGEDLGSYSIVNRSQMEPYLSNTNAVWFCPILVRYYKSRGIYTPATSFWMGRIVTSWELTGGGSTWYAATGRPNPASGR